MRDKDDYLLLSQLTQAGYCLRRVALVMNEQLWQESADTAKGSAEHEKVHTQRIERRSNELKLFEYEVFSETLGIKGKCDCIEAVKDASGCTIQAAKTSLCAMQELLRMRPCVNTFTMPQNSFRDMLPCLKNVRTSIQCEASKALLPPSIFHASTQC